MVRFAIFFLIPRLAGQNTYQLAAQQVGRNPTRQAILQVEQQLGPVRWTVPSASPPISL